MRLAELHGKRIAIWGFGREGRATLQVLRAKFPEQTLTIFCSASEAEEITALCLQSACAVAGASNAPPLIRRGSREAAAFGFSKRTQVSAVNSEEMAFTSISSHSGSDTFPASGAARHLLPAGEGKVLVVSNPPDAAALSNFDIVIKSPGISPYREPCPAAQAAGVRFTSGSAIWFAEHPDAKTICVTGTKGKSTVTALIAHLLRQGGQRVALAGNIGMPLLELLQPSSEPDWWVIELSSFQTRDFDGAPTVAVINNLYEEHLDWHGSRAAYIADKLAIARRAQCVVSNRQYSGLVDTDAAAKRVLFNIESGWHVRDAAVYRGSERVLSRAKIPLPGEHNAQNVCAALAAIEAAGEDARDLARHVATFRPLPHRLQALGSRDGVAYINDSISTTPYAAIEALRSVGRRAVAILVGGFDRGVDWQPFVEYVATISGLNIVTMGANGSMIADDLSRLHNPMFALARATTLADAVTKARALVAPGAVILLSPGAPSFDQFHDYAERGREFARLAGFDPTAIAQIEGLGIA